jgi:mRNA interferase RelE/StbE
MTYPVVWLSEAMSAFRRLRAADPDGAKQVAAAVAALSSDPHPSRSTALGGSGFHRLRLANYRVLYEVDADTNTIYVINVGSVPEPRT